MSQPATEAAVSVIDYVIGDNVATLQRRANISNGSLGARFGISASAMSLKLRGKRAWSAHDLQIAASLFGVRMAQLTGEEAMPDPTTPAVIFDITPEIAKRRLKKPNLRPKA